MSIISQKSIKKIELKNKPKVILTNNLLSQITQAHYYAGRTEWSGLILYSEKAGSIEDLDNLVLECNYFHLMNVGNEMYTEIDLNNNLVELFDEYPDFIDYRQGKIH